MEVNDYLGTEVSPHLKRTDKRGCVSCPETDIAGIEKCFKVCICYLESHQREEHSSEGLTGTIDSLRAAGMEGVPAKRLPANAHPCPAVSDFLCHSAYTK